MSESVIDVASLADAVERRVKSEHVTFRAAAQEIGVSPSLLTRLRNGQRPDLEAFARIVTWLKMPADSFFIPEGQSTRYDGAALETSISALLRARSDLNELDKKYLQDILESGIAHFHKTRRQG